MSQSRKGPTLEQPILLDYRIEKTKSVVSETDHYVGGYPIDSCAVIAALK